MKNITNDQLKAAMSAAENARRELSSAREGIHFARAQMRAKHRSDTERVLSPLLIDRSSLDLREFEKLREYWRSDFRYFLQRQKTQNVALRDSVRSGMESRRGMIQELVSLKGKTSDPPDFDLYVLDGSAGFTSSISVTTVRNGLRDHAATFSADWSGEGLVDESVAFWFAFENPYDHSVLINAETYFLVNGFMWAEVPPDLFAANFASMHVSAGLDSWELWNDPPTRAPFQATQSQFVGREDVEENGLIVAGAFAYDNVNNVFDVQRFNLIMPPHGVIVFQASLGLAHRIDGNGSTGLGSFGFECPLVGVAILP